MRIVSGSHKGKRIIAPKKLPVRPTTDMAKEALFNILNNSYYFEDIGVIDLFAGTGNISYEFASRGTGNIIAVDANHGCVKFIDTISKDLGFNITTFKGDVFGFLEKTGTKADIIFADPPYDLDLEAFSKITELVFNNQLLLEGGTLVLEHSKHMKLSHLPHFSEQRRYGGSVFSFFHPIEEE